MSCQPWQLCIAPKVNGEPSTGQDFEKLPTPPELLPVADPDPAASVGLRGSFRRAKPPQLMALEWVLAGDGEAGNAGQRRAAAARAWGRTLFELRRHANRLRAENRRALEYFAMNLVMAARAQESRLCAEFDEFRRWVATQEKSGIPEAVRGPLYRDNPTLALSDVRRWSTENRAYIGALAVRWREALVA